jgi:hypothetical protein
MIPIELVRNIFLVVKAVFIDPAQSKLVLESMTKQQAFHFKKFYLSLKIFRRLWKTISDLYNDFIESIMLYRAEVAPFEYFKYIKYCL